MIVVITRPGDRHGVHVIELLKKRGVSVLTLEYGEFPGRIHLNFKISQGNRMLELELLDGRHVNAREITSVLYRRRNQPIAADNISDPAIREYIEREPWNFMDALPTMIPCRWVSNPDAIEVASRKPYQLSIAAELGFRVPDSLVGNSPTAAKDFAFRAKGSIAAKALWTPGIRTSDDKGVTLFTRRLSPETVIAHAESIANCPTILQEYIEKAFELRITIVGWEVFACAIYSQATDKTKEDWRRYDLANTPHKAFTLPDDVRERCARLVHRLGLSFGCIDMIVTPDSEYVFLEINPNGQWLWIEQLTGLPISEALVDLLTAP